MNTRQIAWSIVGVLSLSAAARAGAVLELVPSNSGPYFVVPEKVVVRRRDGAKGADRQWWALVRA